MTYFDKIVQKLFADKKPQGIAEVHEVLQRSPKEQEQYKTWVSSPAQEELFRELAQAYYYKKTNIRSTLEVHLFNTAYANGFALTYHADVGADNFQHLFDYFKDKVLQMEYRLVTADRRVLDREHYVETIEKYYLKPPLGVQEQAPQMIDQHYGNIIIEYILINNKPSYMKLLASIYSDSLYKEALSYDEFMSRPFHMP